MEITVRESPAEASREVARRIADVIRDHPAAVIALPTGRTPIAAYEELGRLYRSGLVELSRASFFGLDEFVGIPAHHPGSFRGYLERHLFSTISFDRARL